MKFGELLSCSHPLIRLFGLCQWLCPKNGCVLWLTTCHYPQFGGYQKWLCAKVDDLPLSIVLATTENGSGAAPTECKRLYICNGQFSIDCRWRTCSLFSLELLRTLHVGFWSPEFDRFSDKNPLKTTDLIIASAFGT